MRLKDVMKRRVTVVTPDTLLREAARKMKVAGISVLPVCEGRRVVGLLSARDITVRATARGCDARTTRVREVMTTPAICGREDDDLAAATVPMQRWRLSRLPVLNRRLELAGIVSLRELRAKMGGASQSAQKSKAKRHPRTRRTRPSSTQENI